MAALLEYKHRVRMPPEEPLRAPRLKRGLDLRFWGACFWLGTTALAWSISAHALALPSWLRDAESSREYSATAPTNPTDEERAAEATPSEPAATEAVTAPATETAVATAIATRTPTATATATEPPTEPLASRAETTTPAEAPAAPDDEPAQVAKAEPAFAPPAPPEQHAAFKSGMSCEAALAAYQEEIQVGGPAGPADLTRDAFASVLENGSWFAHCNVPSSFSVEICVATKEGRAVGVTVRTGPRSYKTEACIARAASRLAFPSSPRLDVTRTAFEAD